MIEVEDVHVRQRTEVHTQPVRHEPGVRVECFVPTTGEGQRVARPGIGHHDLLARMHTPIPEGLELVGQDHGHLRIRIRVGFDAHVEDEGVVPSRPDGRVGIHPDAFAEQFGVGTHVRGGVGQHHEACAMTWDADVVDDEVAFVPYEVSDSVGSALPVVGRHVPATAPRSEIPTENISGPRTRNGSLFEVPFGHQVTGRDDSAGVDDRWTLHESEVVENRQNERIQVSTSMFFCCLTLDYRSVDRPDSIPKI